MIVASTWLNIRKTHYLRLKAEFDTVDVVLPFLAYTLILQKCHTEPFVKKNVAKCIEDGLAAEGGRDHIRNSND